MDLPHFEWFEQLAPFLLSFIVCIIWYQYIAMYLGTTAWLIPNQIGKGVNIFILYQQHISKTVSIVPYMLCMLRLDMIIHIVK